MAIKEYLKDDPRVSVGDIKNTGGANIGGNLEGDRQGISTLSAGDMQTDGGMQRVTKGDNQAQSSTRFGTTSTPTPLQDRFITPDNKDQATKRAPRQDSLYQDRVIDNVDLPGTDTGGADTTTPTVTTTTPSTTTTTPEEPNALKDLLTSTITNPVLPEGAKQEYVSIEEKAGEAMDASKFQISQEALEAAKAEVTQIAAMKEAELATTGQVSPTTAAQYAAAQAKEVAATKVVQGEVSKTVSAVTGQLSSGAMAEAAIQDLDKLDPRTVVDAVTKELPNSATVKGQLDGLLEGLETGKVPLWAQPAVAQAEAMLASRGMSTSSVGKQAMFNAVISAAMPIAQQDAQAKLSVFQQNLSNEQQATLANAQFFQTMTAQNLSNKQQTALANAATVAAMDMSNADRAQQAQIANAQNFLQMDITNMNNQQQAAMLDSQLKQQTLLSNQSAENAAKQFNAANQQQADQFNANLATSIEQFNATQSNAMSQFNTGQSNQAALQQAQIADSVAKFNSQNAFNREQFNVQNATAIEQSNVNWRRQINQANTAGINAVNQANAMNQFNLSNQALTFLWQEQRDNAKWAYESSENEEERKVRMAIAALSNESMADATSAANITSLAKAAAGLFDSWMSNP